MLTAQAVGAYGEKVVEAELLRRGWIPSNVNASVKNAADYDILAQKKGRVVCLRIKTCGPNVGGFQFGSPKGTSGVLDFTVLVRMGEQRESDQFYVVPTGIVRDEISARERDYIGQLKRDGGERKNTGHWTLRLQQRKDGREEGGWGLAHKWKQHLDAWEALDTD
jgi:hypothetical protein